MSSLYDVTDDVVRKFTANHQLVWYLTDESTRVFTQIQEAGRVLTDRRKDRKEPNAKVHVIMHDKLCGFYVDVPTLVPPSDDTNKSLVALHHMALDANGIKQAYPKTKELLFPVEEPIIFVLRDWEAALNDNPLLVQGLRDFIQSDMGSGSFYNSHDDEESMRGKRLLVLVTSTDKIPLGIPEIKPIHVALPDRAIIRRCVDSTLDPLVKAKKLGGNTDKASLDKAKVGITEALAGMTYQQALDTVSLAIASKPSLDNLPQIYNIIENEKATHIANIPGLSYISKDRITPADQMPGYEPVIDWVNMCINIDPEEAAKHLVQPLRGMMLAGAPGTGKTTVAMAVAGVAKRILLLWNMGASQGEFVGQSERATQRVIQIANAMKAVVLLDDMDKGGIKVASGASETSVEGGPFGRMVQMLLTAMSSPDNEAIWIFTGNRIKNVPPELIRPGRMDERWFVKRPNEVTREAILGVHIAKRGFDINESRVGLIASDTITDGWTGSELEALVTFAVKDALSRGEKKLNFDVMTKKARTTTPMCKQEAYKQDIKDMEDACDSWTHCGVIEGVQKEKAVKAARSSRTID